jgi:PhnB protein
MSKDAEHIMANPAPEGWHCVTPRIFVREPDKLVKFVKYVFGATGEFETTRPSILRIGDSNIMVSGTEFRDHMPAFLYVYVENVDTTHERALQAGASSLEEPQVTPYGDRRSMVSDRWGNVWQIAARNDSPRP